MEFGASRFNPIVDKSAVSQTGYIDLKSAFVNSAIPSKLPDAESDYNGIDEPASILGKPRDVFEAMDMQSHINSFKSSSTADSDESE